MEKFGERKGGENDVGSNVRTSEQEQQHQPKPEIINKQA